MNMQIVTEAILHTLIENYTAYEIQALTDFYSTPLGRSYLQNLGMSESADPLRAARDFFSTPTGQSLLRKNKSFTSTVLSVFMKEFAKAAQSG